MKFENLTLFLLAYTFGRISPNSKIRKVTTTTSTRNLKSIPRNTAFSFPKNSSVTDSKINTMAMLMVLFATRIVAKSFFGFSSRLTTIFCFTDLFPLVGIRSEGVREKNATSAPEISAEKQSKINITSTLMVWERSMVEIRKIKLGGSGSKCFNFS